MQRHAYAEAVAHFSTGLALLKPLPNTLERRHQELCLQVSLSVPLILTRGYTALEVEATCSRACELCQGIGDTLHLFFPVYGLYRFYLVSGRLHAARELAEQLVSLTQHSPDAAMRLTASSAAAAVAFFRGEFVTAHGLIEHSIIRYDPDGQGAVMVQYGDDPRVIWPSFGGLILWMQGYPDQALKRSQQTLAVARQLAHPFSQLFARTFAVVFHQLRREARLTQERAEASMRVSTEQGFPFWLAMDMVLRGWALAQDRLAEGLEQIGQGLEALRTSGAYLWWSYFLGLWAEAHEKGGQPAEGLLVLEEALSLAGSEGEEPWYDAELYRLRGALLLTSTGQGPQTTVQQGRGASVRSRDLEAAVYFQKAIEIARQQHAKALEFRVAMSLSRLWQRQGMRNEAQQLLTPIYDWFIEGFDTADMQEAQALLEVLS
jgi:tetratricopeptide (TPR) repeat protein